MELELKHTKGEWMLPHFVTNDKKDDECQCGYVLNEGYCGAIATVHYSINKDVENGDNPLKDEAIANAKLICAAPDLLEAAIKAIELVDLWAPNFSNEEIKECHIGELAALSNMRTELEKSIKKATK